jgi:hypothetical protein
MSLGRKRINFEEVFADFIQVVELIFTCPATENAPKVAAMDLFQ